MLRSIIRFYFLSFLSAVLLVLAFPKTDLWILAWVGLVPLFFAYDAQSKRQAFFVSLFAGFVFFVGTLYWISFVTTVGMLILALYLSLYFGIFGAFYVYFKKAAPLWKLFIYPSLWVGLEFMRDHLFTGFGWACLGYSQYKNLPIIQIADMTGVWGVSFLMVMVNFAIKEFLSVFIIEKVKFNFKEHGKFFLIPSAVLVLVLVYGYSLLNFFVHSNQKIAVAVIQGNIPQDLKWQEDEESSIIAKYKALSTEAASNRPELIIWPETAFPGFLNEDEEEILKLREYVKSLGIPLLFGVVTDEEDRYYNSAVLFNSQGALAGRYDKIHLVPFGEFVPFRRQFPFLANMVPIEDFTSDKDFKVFDPIPFSVLVCFEDTFSNLTRQFVRSGARMLVNITNDAWFYDTKEHSMHLQAAVFRAVENRRSLVRASNTGVSGFIDARGRLYNKLQNAHGEDAFVTGSATAMVDLHEKISFYTNFGDIFTYLCFGCILLAFIQKKNGKWLFDPIDFYE